MMHLGDITKISGFNAPPVDVVIGGSPCQDLSVAGKRAGLAGARSGLYMEQVRIVREMRERDRAAGRTGINIRPRYMVWENVPGAFSSNKGRDFAAVLEEVIRIAEPQAPAVDVPDKGWPTWGGYRDVDGGWSVAWRVLDAQYWGVPQRRRRIALVGDFAGGSAHEILFNRNGVQGHPAPRGTTGQGAAEDAARGAGGAVCAGFKLGNSEQARGIGYAVEQAPTLNAEAGGNKPAVCYGISSYDSNAMRSSNPHSGVYEADTSRTLDVGGGNPACNQGGICIVDVQHRQDGVRIYEGSAPSRTARMGTGGNNVPLTYQMRAFGDYHESSVGSACKQRDYKDAVDLVCYPDVVIPLSNRGNPTGISETLRAGSHGALPMVCTDGIAAVDCRNGAENGEVNGTLQANSNGGVSYNLQNVVWTGCTVRRLTPLECERLQGYPDGWTDIGDWTDSKGKMRKTSDAARYKALGNSIALPPWRWVLKRISAEYERNATMASLFDGIGGFPLIWEALNGRGSCLWASEIEEFPIAVTRLRFGGDVP